MSDVGKGACRSDVCVGGGEGGAALGGALGGALEADGVVGSSGAAGGAGTGLRRPTAFGAGFLPVTAELISVDIFTTTTLLECPDLDSTQATGR